MNLGNLSIRAKHSVVGFFSNRTLRSLFVAAFCYQTFLLLLLISFVIYNQGFPIISNFKTALNFWDGRHYIFIAKNGYVNVGEDERLMAFFPLYPLLIRTLTTLGFDPYFAGFIISFCASIGGRIYFGLFLLELGFSKQRMWRILSLLAACPIAIYFSLIYTEALFLFESAAFLYYLQKKNYRTASFLAFLATLTRPFGFLFAIPYLIEIRSVPNFKNYLKEASKILAVPLAFLFYLYLNHLVFNDPFYFLGLQKKYWSKYTMNPIDSYSRALVLTYKGFLHPEQTIRIDTFSTLALPLILCCYLVLVFLRKAKLYPTLLSWTIAQMLLIISISYWLSNTRFICLILPLYIMLESLICRPKELYAAILGALFALSIHACWLYSKGAWVY